MTVEHAAYRQAQVFTEPWFLTPGSIAEGHCLAIGPYGDHDPGFVVVDGILRVAGAEDIYVARTLTEAVSGTARFLVPATTGELELRGEIDQIILHNAQGSGGATSCRLHGALTARRNSGKEAGHPGHGELVARATPVANATTVYTLSVRRKLTVSAVKTWTKVPASGAACTAAVAGGGNNLLSAASINVAALTTVTLESHTLTAEPANLDLDPGDSITITVVGGVGLTPGDLLVAIGYTLR